MIVKKTCIVAVVLLFTLSFFANAQVTIYKNNIKTPTDVDSAELPVWNIGNYWKYVMDFDFIAREGSSITFSVNAAIENMYAALTSIQNINDEEIYVLTLDGDIHGKISLFNIELEIADFNGDFWGDAYIGKNTLGIKKFEFEVDGQVKIPILGWKHMYFKMIMDFDPCFDFFDFPIDINEAPWDVHIDEASLTAYVDVDVPFGEQDFSSSLMFNDVISAEGTESVEVPAGSYDSIIIEGTWGYLSNLWYAPDVGYLVKVDEGLNWENGSIQSVFHLNLIETNYDVGNDPPNPPDKPYGAQDGEVENEYTYLTKGTDPNGDNIEYLFEWGDGSDSNWLGPYASGTTVSASHIWHNKGFYNVKVKIKDAFGLESCWSEPLPVLIKGYPNVEVTIYSININQETDPIDIGSEPELYYTVSCLSQGMSSPPQTFCNTDDGTYEGEWNEASFWEPNKDHEFKGYSRNTTINIKLMDYDDRWDDPLNGADDLADVSGCKGGGVDNDVSFERGAIYHGTYDLAEKQLKPYQTGAADENADYVFKQDSYYITSGENQPDSSENKDENDAEVRFKLDSDYMHPDATAILVDEYEKIRPNQKLNFNAVVKYGTPYYSWHWDFGDEGTSTKQNPDHVYTKSGTYSVILTLTDGFEQTSTDTIEIVVENNNPVLTKDKVQWTGNGGLDDTFTFSVHYLDSDGDSPFVKDVVIDENAYMLSGFGSNNDYTLDLIGSAIGQGNHKFYFHFDDGYGGSVTTPEKTFSVVKSKGFSKSLYTFFENLMQTFSIFQKFIFHFFN